MPDADEDWLNRRYYGGDLPAEAERALHVAAANWGDPAAVDAALAEAEVLAPGHRAVLIGRYKAHFYRHELAAAAPVALACVRDSARALNLPADWRAVAPDPARFESLAAEPRFFLFALKAYGYVCVRAGNAAEGTAALAKVVDLDPQDATGTRRLLALVEAGGLPDDEDDADG
ncbi:hypothetical protein C882_2604 [Caenispirillum salinarum AK4]|uniref:Tetratricopeptide repeat protein n=1 Tax=Caenispirillum salinarum AK4 TaxID=1238182 RepID=K9H2P6_9PROT|nr:hypothetical protein [Caenispirillum salinarum]EKV32525.1 hypothetical protein C882_2604 [Caenispirillum salinarum AK4]